MNNRAELINSHGFGFLWRDYREGAIAAYSITIVDINPYSKSLYEYEVNKGIHQQLQSVLNDDEASGHTYSIHYIIEAGSLFLDSICSVIPEGSLNWSDLKKYMLENSKLIEFRCWGFIAEKYEFQLAKYYVNGCVLKNYNDPDVGLDFVETKLFEN